jgi:hypothetical protein
MKRVLYHNESPRIPSELFIVKENEDGTVDLTRDGKELIVTSCPVSDTPKVGHCTDFPEEEEKKPAPKGKKNSDA